MISVDVVRNEYNDVISIFISGHSNYAKSGLDIVCSAVSTASITSINLLLKNKSKIDFKSDESKPMIDLKIIEVTEFTNLVSNNLVDVLNGIASSYSKYLKINEIRR